MSKAVTSVAQVEQLRDQLEKHAEDWAPREGNVDWDDYLYRVETALDIDLPSNMLDPVIIRVKALTRLVIRQMQ